MREVSMDFQLRRHGDTHTPSVDRISSLPDDLLARIMSLLNTKEAAATTVLSQKMRRVFAWRSSLDFSDLPIFHCLGAPHLIQRFEIFKLFVDTVLAAFHSPCLSSFRLRLGGDMNWRLFPNIHGCKPCCFPPLNPLHLNAWICFPFTRCGIKEIDLCIHVRNPGELPTTLFACETLHSLKLDVNLSIAQVCTMPSFHLPNLKVFHLLSLLITEDDFLTRLVSSCPSLEDLSVWAWWKQGRFLHISSPSLQRFVVRNFNDDTEPRKFVRIDTPNVHFLHYDDELAMSYSVTSMNALVHAILDIVHWPVMIAPPRNILQLIKDVHTVQRLCLSCSCLEGIFRSRAPINTPQATNLDRVFRENRVVPSCVLHLKRVLIGYYKGEEFELELVKLFLRNATVLEELVISSCMVNLRSLESTLKLLPRASVACSIKVIAQVMKNSYLLFQLPQQ